MHKIRCASSETISRDGFDRLHKKRVSNTDISHQSMRCTVNIESHYPLESVEHISSESVFDDNTAACVCSTVSVIH